MKAITTLISIFLFCASISAQDRQKYRELIGEAYALYQSEDYKASGLKYSEAFVVFGNKGYQYDRYNAACAYSLGNMPDSAFAQLNKICTEDDEGYAEYDHMSEDVDFKNVYGDPRWETSLGIVKKNQDRIQANYDWPLIAKLRKVYESDQGGRQKIREIEKEFGYDSPEMKSLWKDIHLSDSLNLIIVQKILDERGWIGSDIVSPLGNSTLFLVVQHADLTVQEKYLPMMREAAKNGNAQKSSLALLEDRIALRQGKRQIYGSQIGRDKESGKNYVLPLENPEKVDERRAEVNLGTIAEYTSYFQFEWDLQQHKIDTKMHEKKNKKQIKKNRKEAKKRGAY